MNVNLSGVAALSAGAVGARSIQSELTTTKTSRHHTAKVDDSCQADNYQKARTDNNRLNSQDELDDSSRIHAIPAHFDYLEPAKLTKLSEGYQPEGDAKWTRLKAFLGDTSKGVIAGLKEQARVNNAGKELALSGQKLERLTFQNKSLKLTMQPTSDQGTAVVVRSVEHGVDRKNPNAKPYQLNAVQRPAESPRKSQSTAEKTAKHDSTNNPELAKSTANETQTGVTSADSRPRILNGIRPQTCSAQTKTASPDPSGYSFHTCQTILSEQSSTLSQTTRIANDAPPSPDLIGVGGNVSQQIAVSIEGSLRQGDTHLTVYLNPPELGEVFVRFQQEQDQKITVLFEVNKPETRREIELTLPQIMRNLQDSGVQIRRLEVSAPSGSDELERQPDAGAPGQDNGEMAQHHFAGESDSDHDLIGVPRSSTNDAESFHEWLTSTVKDIYQGDFAPQMVFADGSINMLV